MPTIYFNIGKIHHVGGDALNDNMSLIDIKINITKAILADENIIIDTSIEKCSSYGYFSSYDYIVLYKNWVFNFGDGSISTQYGKKISPNELWNSPVYTILEKQFIKAVQQYGMAILYIKNPSEEVKRLAVQEDGYAIQYIDNPSEELQKLAVQQYGMAIQHIKNPSEEVKRLAVQEDGNAIDYIDNPSEEVQRLVK